MKIIKSILMLLLVLASIMPSAVFARHANDTIDVRVVKVPSKFKLNVGETVEVTNHVSLEKIKLEAILVAPECESQAADCQRIVYQKPVAKVTIVDTGAAGTLMIREGEFVGLFNRVYIKLISTDIDNKEGTFELFTSTQQSNLPPVITSGSGPGVLKVGNKGYWGIDAYDPENGPLTYIAVWGDEEQSAEISENNTGVLTHTYRKPGIYDITFTVFDDAGNSDKTSTTVRVEIEDPKNLPPVITSSSGPEVLKVGKKGQWTIEAYDPENGQLTYMTVWGDGGLRVDEDSGAAQISISENEENESSAFTHTYQKPGTYYPTFFVSDDAGNSNKLSMTVRVEMADSNEPKVSLEILPPEQSILYGEKAVYKVIIKDLHEEVKCSNLPNTGMCFIPTYLYELTIDNLPFIKQLPATVKLEGGQSKTLEFVVTPYNIITEEAVGITRGNAGATASGTSENVQKTAGTNFEESYAIAKAVRETDENLPETTTSPDAVPAKTSSGFGDLALPRYYRSYKFSITAAEIDNPGNHVTHGAVLHLKPNPLPVPPPFPNETAEIILYSGWNLISLPGKLLRFEKLESETKLIGFVFLKEKQEYFSLKEAQEILGPKFGEYLARNAFWVYSYKNDKLKVKVDREISYNNIDLKSGWNLLPVTEDMVGGFLGDIKGDCKFKNLYIWNANGQEWNRILEDYRFSQSQLNYGFIAQSENDCNLGGVTIKLTPPTFPED